MLRNPQIAKTCRERKSNPSREKLFADLELIRQMLTV
jgi:hypothetical protein